jgi:predicted PurR-regulated permease PerM
LVYLSSFGVIGLLIYISAPIFIDELKQLTHYLPGYFVQVNPVLKQLGINVAQNFSDLTQTLTTELSESSQGIINGLMLLFGGLAATAFIFTISFFLSLEDRATERFLLMLVPQKYEDQIKAIFERVQEKVAGWFGARLLACLFVGVASYIVFFIFGIKYAFLLALICGIFNFVPYVGPWVSGVVLVVFIAVSSGSWLTVLYVLIATSIVQEVENKILTPLLMKRMTDIPPVLVLLSLLLGAKIFGFLGMIFAVPVFGIVYEFMKEFLEKRRTGDLDAQ